MAIFLCKSIAFGRYRVTTLAQTSNIFYSVRWFSLSSSDQKQSFTVSYLINSLGFSPRAALATSRFVKFDSPEKPDKAIEFLKGHSFSKTQISSLVRGYPRTLLCDVEKIILPKFEFLRSKGLLGPELAKGLSLYPTLLKTSLTKQIIPGYEFFSKFFRSDDMTSRAVSRHPDILAYDIEKYVRPKIDTLRRHGVPDPKIATLILHWPRVLYVTSVRFEETMKEVVEMGFDSSKKEFILALYAISLKKRKTTWDRKVNAYKKFGWSDEQVLRAFQKNPWCMMISEKKITAVMDFFITKMGLQPCDLVNIPLLFIYSLEKRIIPRVSFYQVLLLRNLVKNEVSLLTLVMATEKQFLQKYVNVFEDDAPELLKLYKEKLSCSS